jgi:hypothetical protein
LVKRHLDTGKDLNQETQSFDDLGMEILSDGFDFLISDIELAHFYGYHTKEEVNVFYNNLAEDYSEFVHQPNGLNTKPLLIKKPSKTKEVYKELQKDEDLKPISRMFYDLYSQYSKYDHFGFVYNILITQGDDTLIQRIKTSISLLVNHYVNLCDCLQRATPNNEIVFRQWGIAKNYLKNKNS